MLEYLDLIGLLLAVVGCVVAVVFVIYALCFNLTVYKSLFNTKTKEDSKEC